MPFKSQKQRRFMHAKHPKMAMRWEKEARRKGKPAARKKRKRKKR
jgi:hypothetical protein